MSRIVYRIAVGTALAGGPPHRSQRAELPHWAPVSGTNVEARLGIGVQDTDGREPSGDEAVHPLPAEAVALAAAPERSEPVPADLDAEGVDGPSVAGHGVVGEMSSHHACQPPRLVGDGQMPAPLKPNLRGLGWLISCLRCAYDCDTPRYVTTKVVAFRWSMCFDCAMGRRSGRMHVDQAGRHYTTVGGERRSYPTYLLRRSYRDERGRPRKETLANLTGLPEESIAALRATLKGRTLVDAEAAFEVERSVPHGNVAAAHVMASRLGLQGLLGPACRERDIAYALIVSRAVRPESKLSTARWWQAGDTTLGTDLGVANASTDDVYAAMDWLVARQREVEKQLAARHLAEGGIAMFDLSSSWVEGSHCALAGFGHSRDGKRGRRQVEYGLLTDRQGRPVAVEVFPGNTSDPESCKTAIVRIRRDFGITTMIMVGDRGMITGTRIDDLRKLDGMGWITALKAPAIAKLAEDGGPLQLSLFDTHNFAQITHPDYPGERLICCHNP